MPVACHKMAGIHDGRNDSALDSSSGSNIGCRDKKSRANVPAIEFLKEKGCVLSVRTVVEGQVNSFPGSTVKILNLCQDLATQGLVRAKTAFECEHRTHDEKDEEGEKSHPFIVGIPGQNLRRFTSRCPLMVVQAFSDFRGLPL